MMRYHCFNIKYDIDDYSVEDILETEGDEETSVEEERKIILESLQADLYFDVEDDKLQEDCLELDEHLADCISYETGWCVNNFEFEAVPN